MFGVLLKDLSKVFNCLEYELLTVKLTVYGLRLPTPRLVRDYLSSRKERTKIDNTCIWNITDNFSWSSTQGSI